MSAEGYTPTIEAIARNVHYAAKDSEHIDTDMYERGKAYAASVIDVAIRARGEEHR